MTQMTALGKIHTHDGIARFQESKIYSQVSACTAVRLNIGIICAKQFFRTFNSQSFYFINVFTAAIITMSGITFCIFVSQNGTHSLHYCRRYEVFTELIFLPKWVYFR